MCMLKCAFGSVFCSTNVAAGGMAKMAQQTVSPTVARLDSKICANPKRRRAVENWGSSEWDATTVGRTRILIRIYVGTVRIFLYSTLTVYCLFFRKIMRQIVVHISSVFSSEVITEAQNGNSELLQQ